ncbi:hypothetical protein GCM10010324_67440 [Streptomyces hiroshimensis]|uniref:Uncharacterized protein n=1 Tax=Streptomyces hiroshimensis TaxID=66424 RepID=A0ABQ2ZDB0_9ACTN|nr:hypothetical protein GCM10010324_67440 [Streptomyces hiroshimensis]
MRRGLPSAAGTTSPGSQPTSCCAVGRPRHVALISREESGGFPDGALQAAFVVLVALVVVVSLGAASCACGVIASPSIVYVRCTRIEDAWMVSANRSGVDKVCRQRAPR